MSSVGHAMFQMSVHPHFFESRIHLRTTRMLWKVVVHTYVLIIVLLLVVLQDIEEEEDVVLIPTLTKLVPVILQEVSKKKKTVGKV